MSNAEILKIDVWKTWEGRVVDGKFPLRQLLGGSEHSAVFLSERSGTPSQKAAIKLIPADAGDADRQLGRWRAAAQLAHPNLIRIFETGRCDLTMLYVVMEFAEEDLSQILPQRALEAAEVNEMLPPLLDALAYVHGKGFVHSRIKPSNILAVGDQLKLSSDQAVSPTESDPRRKRRDVYDAPETAFGIISLEGDLWSVGATLVTALTQKEPLTGDASQNDPGLSAAIPEPFRGIARECLHLDPKRRCSIAEIQARLRPAGRSVPAPSEPAPPPMQHKSFARRMFIPIAALVVLAAVFAAFSKLFTSKPAKPEPVATSVAPETSKNDASQPVNSAPAQPATVPPQTTTQSVPQSAQQAALQTAPVATHQIPEPAPTPTRKSPASKTPPKSEVLHQVLPDVPRSARNTITGTIKVGVRVEVDPSGKVTNAKLVSEGPSQYFANLALKAARGWEFSPLTVDGQPKPSAWVLRFRFKRSGTQASPEHAH